MARLDSIPVLVWAILAVASWRSSALLHAWQHSPLDRLGWLALLIWTLPALAYLAGPATQDDEAIPTQPRRFPLLAASLLATLGGTLADLNAANYLGLACAIAAIPGLSLRHTAWLATALSWMPALSWALQGLPRPALIAGRLLLAAAGCAAILAPHLRGRTTPAPR